MTMNKLKSLVEKLSECQIQSLPFDFRIITKLVLASDWDLARIVALRKEEISPPHIRSGKATLDCRTILSAQEVEEFVSRWGNLVKGEYIFDSSLSRFRMKNLYLYRLKLTVEANQAQFKTNIKGASLNGMVIGFSRTGTTWFYEMGRQYTQFDMGQKEICYFSTPHYCKGPAWYHSHFTTGKGIRIDVSPDYINEPMFLERIAKYQAEFSPELRYVVILRRPSSRIRSSIYHGLKGGHGWGDLRSYLFSGHVRNNFLNGSNYREKLENAERMLGKDRLLIVFQEDINQDARATFLKIVQFLSPQEDFSAIMQTDSSFFQTKVNASRPIRNFALLRLLRDAEFFLRRIFIGRSISKPFVFLVKKFIAWFCFARTDTPRNTYMEEFLSTKDVQALDAAYERIKSRYTAEYTSPSGHRAAKFSEIK